MIFVRSFGKRFWRYYPIGIVDDRDNAIVGMQINPAVHHLRLLVAKK